MGIVENVYAGFQVVFQPGNLFFCLLGCFIGTLVGVLPGIGPIGTMALLLPTTFHIPSVSAIIMFAGVYYGAMYGGSTTSILVNIPGEAATVVTCLDGHQMARQGRAGPALGMCAFASCIGGTLSVIGLMLIAVPLADIALRFGPPEYFSLACVGLFTLTLLSGKSKLKALIQGTIGLFLATIGLDTISREARFTLGWVNLLDGISIVPLAMGLFGISEVLVNLEKTLERDVFIKKTGSLLPTIGDWITSKWAIARGSVVGFLLGILPGGGAVISSFVAYAVEKKLSKYPERFGTGVIEGVAGPEAANNAACAGSMIPLFALGIPPNATIALLFSAFIIHGIYPGPLVIKQHPELFWGTVTSMYIGNLMLLILNLPLIGMWVKLLSVPYRVLFPFLILFSIIGSYTINNEVGDVLIMLFFGIVGYILRTFRYDGAPLIMGFILGPLIETSLRQSLIMSGGSPLIFLYRPISAALLLAVAILFIFTVIPLKKRTGRR